MQLVQRVIEERVNFVKGVDHRELGNLRYVTQLRERTIAGLRSDERASLTSPFSTSMSRSGRPTATFRPLSLARQL